MDLILREYSEMFLIYYLFVFDILETHNQLNTEKTQKENSELL